MIPRSETMPAILAPSAETTRAPTFSSRMRCKASETVASGVTVHPSRPLLARMCSTFTGRSSPLHRARPEARVPQAPPVDRVRQDRSGLPPLELGQLTFRPDRVGQRAHPAIPVARLDARGLEDQVASRYRPAERSEEHTSELQSHVNLVCRLLLEKKKKLTARKHNNNLDMYTSA